MTGLTLTQQINAPVETVFHLATDLDHWAGRIKGITKIERLTTGPVGVGTRFRETRVMFGRQATEEMEFTVFEPNRRYVLEAESCGCHYRSEFRFEPADGGTRVTMEFGAEGRTFMAKLMGKLMGWMMTGTMRKCVQQDLDDLKAAAEAAPQPA
jgi:carbon monoxide dehydrogenase subunit G